MSGTPIQRYFISLGFQLEKAQLRNVDRQLLHTEKRFQRFGLNINKSLSKAFLNFKLPPLKIKAFDINQLALQKTTQQSLNRIGRLVEMPIMNFSIDQTKLNRQMQTSLQRAANQSKINIKSITGNSGGYGVHHVGGTHQAAFSRYASSTGLGTGLGIGSALSGYLAPSAMAYGAYRGYNALYSGNADAVSNRHAITNVVADPKASYAENTARGKKAYDYLYSESNRLGLDAKGQAEGYQKILASGQASGLSLEQSQRMFTQLSEHATVMHLDTQRQQRLNLSISQMLAKGTVMSEELKGQAGEASSTLPSYFAKAWAEHTKSNLKGAEAMGALMKAMERGEVKSAIALKALELAAKDAQPGLARSTSTSAAEANRARNIRSYSMNEASVAGVEDGFYRVNKAIATFAADLAPHAEQMAVGFAQYLGASADFSMGLRGLAKGIPGAKQDTIKAAQDMPWWYFSQANPVALTGVTAYKATNYIREKMAAPTTATEAGVDRFKALQESFSRPVGMLPLEDYKDSQQRAMRSAMPTSTTTNNTNTVTVDVGGIVVQAGDSANVEQLESKMEGVVTRVMNSAIGRTLQNYTQTE